MLYNKSYSSSEEDKEDTSLEDFILNRGTKSYLSGNK